MRDHASYAAVGITILEEDDGMVSLQVITDKGPVVIVAEVLLLEDRLILDRVDVMGEGLNLGNIRKLAQLCGEVEDVVEVIVIGGRRVSGLHEGRYPTPIRVRVK